MCHCENYLSKTDNVIVSDTAIKYHVYICQECKRYYIKRFCWLLEVKFDVKNQEWNQTGKRIKYKII